MFHFKKKARDNDESRMTNVEGMPKLDNKISARSPRAVSISSFVICYFFCCFLTTALQAADNLGVLEQTEMGRTRTLSGDKTHDVPRLSRTYCTHGHGSGLVEVNIRIQRGFCIVS